MKHLLLLLVACVATSLHASPYNAEIGSLLAKLDSLIERKEVFIAFKEEKIAQLHKQEKEVRTREERFWLNKMFYDEYFVYNADSAMLYVDENLYIAQELKNKEWEAEWKIKKSFLLAATGLLKEALDEIQDVSSNGLSNKLQVEYYSLMMYLYSHFGQYTGDNNTIHREVYYKKERCYKDSLYVTVTPEDPYYLWYKGWNYIGLSGSEAIMDELHKVVASSTLETRQDAMHAYMLARLYNEEGNRDEYLKYLILSGIADVRSANRDIASIEELAGVVFDLGDIDHAYTYINYCLQCAQMFRNRVRVIGIANTQDAIHKAYQERNVEQEARLQLFLIVVSILSIVLLAAIFFIMRQMKHLSISRSKLNETNVLLNNHVEELSLTHTMLAQANQQLKVLNEQLKETNNQLRESNYVKEGYIGYVFAICSNYINKLDEFRKNINRKAKAKQFEEIKTLTNTSTMAQQELKEFYHNFDAIFLDIYPDFVSDFNALLQPEEQIVLKENELLNTELRIYALVRLGINDSVKIANFLHCSPQTIYNNRLRTRNKSIIPKEEFATTVMALGKMQKS